MAVESNRPTYRAFIYLKMVATPVKSNDQGARSAWSPVRSLHSPVPSIKKVESKIRPSIGGTVRRMSVRNSESSTGSSNYEATLRNNLHKAQSEIRKLKRDLETAQVKVRIAESEAKSKLDTSMLLLQQSTAEINRLRTQIGGHSIATQTSEYYLKQLFEKEQTIQLLTTDKQLIQKRMDRVVQDLEKKEKKIEELSKKWEISQSETDVATRQMDVSQFLFQSVGTAIVNVAIAVKLRQMIMQRQSPDYRNQWRDSFDSHLATCNFPTAIKYAYETLKETLGTINEDRDLGRILDAGAQWTCIEDIDAIETAMKDFDDNGYLPDEDDENWNRELSPIKETPEKAGLKVANAQLTEQNAQLVEKIDALETLIMDVERISMEKDEGLLTLLNMIQSPHKKESIHPLYSVITSRSEAFGGLELMLSAQAMAEFLSLNSACLDGADLFFTPPKDPQKVPVPYLLMSLYALKADPTFWKNEELSMQAVPFLQKWLALPESGWGESVDKLFLRPVMCEILLGCYHATDADYVSIDTIFEQITMIQGIETPRALQIVEGFSLKVKSRELTKLEYDLSWLLDNNPLMGSILNLEELSDTDSSSESNKVCLDESIKSPSKKTPTKPLMRINSLIKVASTTSRRRYQSETSVSTASAPKSHSKPIDRNSTPGHVERRLSKGVLGSGKSRRSSLLKPTVASQSQKFVPPNLKNTNPLNKPDKDPK